MEARVSGLSLAGIRGIWHSTIIDCLDLERVERLTPSTFGARCCLVEGQPTVTAIAKVARFEWEMPCVERETDSYRVLERTSLAPGFLGYIHEHGRVIGFLLERVEGREAAVDDLPICQSCLQRVYGLDPLHGGVVRYKFIIARDGTAKLVDSENSRVTTDRSTKQIEMESLRDQLMEESGRSAGFIYEGND